jgi:hypothetical protein
MDSFLREMVKLKISNLKAMEFQYFVDELFSVFYQNDFTIVKQKQDKGSDGIITNNQIIACYSPEKYSLSDFKNKINNNKKGKEGDFVKYKANWEKTHPNWTIVYNGEWLSNMILFVQDLKSDAQVIGLTNLINMSEEMNWTQQQRILKYLGIDDEYIKIDLIEQVIEDLIKSVEKEEGTINSSDIITNFSTNLSKKIPLNYAQEDLELAKLEVQNYLQVSYNIEQIVGGFEKLPALKFKIQESYLNLNKELSFKKRKQILLEQYAGKKINDDLYCYYLAMFLLYIFEQCLIGEKLE